jgi:uncharacterized beta-barrel protein YwiB (DUF1934 family)
MQSYDGMDEDGMELVTQGTLSDHPDGYVIAYAESELTGLEGTQTTLEIGPNCVTLLRTGQICAQMVFEQGRTHRSLYDTPYGSMEIGIRTRQLRSTMGERGGELEVSYSIEVNHSLAGENMFQINVREMAQ